MRFQVGDEAFAIEFRREVREVRVRDPFIKNAVNTMKSQYPFTTVNITVASDKPKREWEIVHTATVGCFKNDAFSIEEGRRFALRSLCKKLPGMKEFKAAMWSAYLTRKDPKPVAVPVVDTNDVVASV